MAIIFCDIQGIILNHFVPPKITVTGNYYATVIKSELLPAIKRKRPHLERSGILLLHDNAPSHSSRIVMDVRSSIFVCHSFRSEVMTWDLVVLVPDYCLLFSTY